jgi:hypothetical protein
MKPNGPRALASIGVVVFAGAIAWHYFLLWRIRNSPFAYEYGSAAWPVHPGPRIAAPIGVGLLLTSFAWFILRGRVER